MRNLITTLFVVLAALTACAQNSTPNSGRNSSLITPQGSSEHLVFKGVPIDGTLASYVAKMKQNGFTHISTEGGVAILQGDFAGYKGCFVAVSTLKQLDLVSKIGVMFPESDTWSPLSSTYFSLKELLTEKYGEPARSEEKFQGYSQPRDDGSRMIDVRLNQCEYYSAFDTDNGDIELSIQGDISNCFVRLLYFDKINSGAVREEALNDL